MQCDLSRAADRSADELPCLGRRSLVRGLAALAAATSMPAPAKGRHDEAIFYLQRRFDELAVEFANISDGMLQVTAFTRMTDYAKALSLLPAKHPSAVLAKRAVAAWSWRERWSTMRLPTEVVDALVSSAERDG